MELFVAHGVDGFDAHGAKGWCQPGYHAKDCEQRQGADRCPEAHLEMGGDDASGGGFGCLVCCGGFREES